jgi:hypothetical protein
MDPQEKQLSATNAKGIGARVSRRGHEWF